MISPLSKTFSRTLACLFLSTALGHGASASSEQGTAEKGEQPRAEVVALYSPRPILFDGSLDDPIWQKAPKIAMNVAWRPLTPELPLYEGGTVQFAWDDTHFFLAASLEDADLVAEGEEDNLHHYRFGDLIELFLKPASERYYWELYGTPTGQKTTFFIPSRGRLPVPSSFVAEVGLKVAAKVDGTVNNWRDKDKGWTVVLSIPIKELTALGATIAPGEPAWHVLVARYNYSVYHEVQNGEISTCTPHNDLYNFHIHEKWSALRFVKESQ